MDAVLSRSPGPDAVIRMFDAHGLLAYGESVNQVQHALQCAALAEAGGADDALVVAALLHDVGHMLHRDAARALKAGEDDQHERLGAEALEQWFGPRVAVPVALHVMAKRYLCAREPGYLEALSPVSTRTLALQGGPMDAEEVARFERLEHAQDAVRLRRWDDAAKTRGLETPPLAHFMERVRNCAIGR
jgi:phosphonate degradation associated HDIG domain protein